MGCPHGGGVAVPVDDREQLPLAGESSERVRASLFERQIGAGHHVANGAGHEHLPRIGTLDDASPDVDGYASDAARILDAFRGVQPGPHGQPELAERNRDLGRAPHGRCRRGEGCEEAVADVVDLTAAEALQQVPNLRVVGSQQKGPATIAERCCQSSGPDQIGEEQGDQDTGLDLVSGGCTVWVLVVHVDHHFPSGR